MREFLRALYRHRSNDAFRYGVAVVVVGVISAVRYVLPLDTAPFLLYMPAIFLVGVALGRHPALVGLTISTAFSAYFFYRSPPYGGFSLGQVLALVQYAVIGVAMVLVCDALRNLLAENEAALHRMKEMNATLTANQETLAAAKEAAEEANRTKSDFIANMSHELRTPLSAIIGYSEMMQEEMAEGTEPANLTPDMHKVESNARHLLGLINDVLDLSKIESGKMEVYAEEFAVEPTLRDMVSTVESLISRRGNVLALRLEADLGSMRTDVTKLRQILLNLLSNAAKFTEGGTVTLSASRLPGGTGGDWVVFRVSDTGIGMTEEQLGRLFQRFTQADSSTTRKFGGTGLGLSISKAFGTMLGGDLSVESRTGEGSTFTVFLPAQVGEASPSQESLTSVTPRAADATTAHAKGVVLVIDDDPTQRELMTRFLSREGFGAVTAADGYAGIQLAKSLVPRAILLDVTMPGLDGWSVLSALKADEASSHIPVIMVTFVDERGLATSLGASDYVMKPVRWETLRTVMDRYRGGDGAVLIVDDDEDMRRHARSVLEREGWPVVEAGDGVEALDRVAQAIPRLILLDLDMPIMDGFDFLRAFRARSGCADVPVVVLTAKDLTRDDRRRLQGADKVLGKGVTSLADLSRELANVMKSVRENA